MKKASKKSSDGTQGTLPQFKIQLGQAGVMPVEFTSGDAFFNPNTISGFSNNSQLGETVAQAPHPLLNSKIAKEPASHAISQPVPKTSPPSPVIGPPRLVPPPPPVAFSPAPPPIPSPSLVGLIPRTKASPPLNSESTGDEYSDLEPDLTYMEKMPQQILSPPVAPVIVSNADTEIHPISPAKPANQIRKLFKQAMGIV